MIPYEVVAHTVETPLQQVIALVMFVVIGFVGTAVLMVLPVLVWKFADRQDRRLQIGEMTTSDAILDNHLLEQQLERSK